MCNRVVGKGQFYLVNISVRRSHQSTELEPPSVLFQVLGLEMLK